MMTDPLTDFYVHTALVSVENGVNGLGETITVDSDPFPCFINDQAKLVRDAHGQSTIGATTLTCSNRYAALFHMDGVVYQLLSDRSRIPKGRIVLVNTADSGALNLPDHTTVSLV